MRPSGNTPPANFTQQGITPLLSGIDGLYAGYYGEVRERVLRMIAEGINPLQIGDMVFDVKGPRGTYRATLDNESLNVALDNCARSADSPSAYVQVKSGFIWSEGLHSAYEQLTGIMNCLYRRGLEGEKVSRVDLFADFLWPGKFRESDVHKLVTKADHKNVHLEGHRVSGFDIGKGDLHARIYNKSFKARKEGSEGFFDLWGIDPTANEGDVWRVEFQLRRPVLKDFDVESFDDLVNTSQSIWDYCTGNWLSMREAGKANVSRRQPTPFWEQVQSAKLEVEAESPKATQRIRRRAGMTVEQGIAHMAGIARSVARGSEIESPGLALDIMLPGVRTRIGE